MGCSHTLGRFPRDSTRLPWSQLTLTANSVGEHFSRQERHSDVRDAVVLTYFVNRHNVIVLQGGLCLCFALKSLPGLSVCSGHWKHYLECDSAFEPTIFSQVDDTHTATT